MVKLDYWRMYATNPSVCSAAFRANQKNGYQNHTLLDLYEGEYKKRFRGLRLMTDGRIIATFRKVLKPRDWI